VNEHRRLTRRQFLEDSVLAAAAAATLSAGAVAVADEKTVKRPNSVRPGESLHIAVLGAGIRGGVHIEEFLNRPDTAIDYIVDPDRERGQKCALAVSKRQKVAPKYAPDLRTALDDKSVDIVSIATPNHWHALAAIWAMQAGKDVYLEKPVSHNVREGRRIVEAARKYNRICQTGTQCRSMQGTIDAVEYVRSGKIGKVKLARGLCYNRRTPIGSKGNYPVPPQVDYNLWCGPSRMLPLTRQQFHYDWHWQREWGNGDIGNQGPHQIDIARWGLSVDRLADRVIAFGGRFGYTDAGDVANTEVALFTFADKTIVFEVRGLKTTAFRGVKVGVIFYGSEGCVVLDNYCGGAALDPYGKVIRNFRGDGDHFGNFIDAVKARDSRLLRADILEGHLSCAHSHLANVSYYLGTPASANEIRRSIEAIDAADDAADCLHRMTQHLTANGVDVNKTPMLLGPMLELDSGSETIRNNATAAALLDRERRPPFTLPG
jgi:predicted dehydrogenase